jgi:oxygen-independent coproporphyrinogen-3 oxidase
MDHFARADDELALALEDGTLQRNFQGYSTHGDCEMLGFGVSSIGCVAGTYLQNTKDIDSWEASITAGLLPVQRGYELTEDDRRCAYVIQELMCRQRLDAGAFRAHFGEGFWTCFGYTRPALELLAADGLVQLSPTGIEVLPAGRMLIRHVAMVFDAHLMRSRGAQYSKVI